MITRAQLNILFEQALAAGDEELAREVAVLMLSPCRLEANGEEPYKFIISKDHSIRANINAFVWETTPQGHDFWSRLHERY